MRLSRWFIAALTGLLGLLAAGALGACSAPQASVTEPAHVNEQISQLLAARGYQSMSTTTISIGTGTDAKTYNDVVIFVHCKANEKFHDCAANRHNEATASHPNIYVVGDQVLLLEGPHVKESIGCSIYLVVPANWRGFLRLTSEQQNALLGIMPEVVSKVMDEFMSVGYTGTPYLVDLDGLDQDAAYAQSSNDSSI